MCFFSTADAIAATPSRSPKPYEIKNLSSGSEGVPQTWLTTIYTYIIYHIHTTMHTYLYIYIQIHSYRLTYLLTYVPTTYSMEVRRYRAEARRQTPNISNPTLKKARANNKHNEARQ